MNVFFSFPFFPFVLPFRGGYVVWHIRIHDCPSGLSLLSLHNDLLYLRYFSLLFTLLLLLLLLSHFSHVRLCATP